MTATCDREAEEAQKALAELEEQQFTKEEYRKHIGEVKTRLDAAVRDAGTGMITNEFVAQYIDKIIVTSGGNDTAKLEIKIFTGKNTEKWLKKLSERHRSRTGVTMNNMNPTRTLKFKRKDRISQGHMRTIRYTVSITV